MKKYKKFIPILLTLILFITNISFVNAISQAPNVSAHAYAVMDAHSGEIIYSKDANKKIYPASTTKMLTAIVALDNASLSKKITVRKDVVSQVDSDASQLNLKPGSTYTLEQLLHMLLLYSCADSADTIAVGVCGSKSEFIRQMNKKAKVIGMTNSNFDNTIGLDYDNGFNNIYSTAHDIAKLTQYVMGNEIIRKIVSKPSYNIYNFNGNTTKTIKNTNRFLIDKWYPKDLYKVIGTKTGTTPAAGYALSTTAINKSGEEVICTFFGNVSRAKMYEDIEKLLTFTFKNSNSNVINLESGMYDVRNHWAKENVLDFVDKKYVGGYLDYTFKPDNKITRAEFINIFNNVFNLTNKSGKVFEDTKNHWAKSAIDIAITNGVCSGKTNTKFKPNDFITREEAAVMLSNYLKISDNDYNKLNSYSDSSTVSTWAKSSVEGVLKKGYMNGYSNNTFRAKSNITRAEAVAMLSRIN